MDSATLKMASSKFILCHKASVVVSPKKMVNNYGFNFKGSLFSRKIYASNGSVSSLREDANRQRSNLESLFCYDKAIPEERIEKPVGLSLAEKAIGNNPQCTDCQAKGSVLCTTCAGSGLYVDSILESQGIIVKVRCLGCGGTGNMMCTGCGGRGHLGPK